MGLRKEELNKVPYDLTARECYERIFRWHKKYGREVVEQKYYTGEEDRIISALDNIFKVKGLKRVERRLKLRRTYKKAYLELLELMPEPNKAKDACLDHMFSQVIKGYFEWSYHEEDENEIKMGAYAVKGKKDLYRKTLEKDKLSLECSPFGVCPLSVIFNFKDYEKVQHAVPEIGRLLKELSEV